MSDPKYPVIKLLPPLLPGLDLGETFSLQNKTCKDLVKDLLKKSKGLAPSDLSYLICRWCQEKRHGSENCTFRGLRAVSSGEIFFGHLIQPAAPIFPSIYSRSLTEDEINALRTYIATALIPLLKREHSHDKKHRDTMLYRKRDLTLREVCGELTPIKPTEPEVLNALEDSCRMSLFGQSWFCTLCGKDLCSACHQDLKDCILQTAIGFCLPGRDSHTGDLFIPSTRFGEKELEEMIHDMESLLLSPIKYSLYKDPSFFTCDQVDQAYITSTPLRIPNKKLLPHEFRLFLSKRLPLVVTNLNEQLQLSWSPAELSKEYGTQACRMENCEDPTHIEGTTLGHFLDRFEVNRENVIWKVKDWPDTAELSKSHPILSQDFDSVLPVKDYTSRNGALNIAAHYPMNSLVKPDLGPKVYMALASVQSDDYHGSTRLHCDLSDAFNIMVYADPPSSTALWHIFKATDADTIRSYLRSRLNRSSDEGDPIHSQVFYMGPSQLKELEEVHGVKPFVIEQAVGEAVYIPAGCAHQVSNRANCIKVATDFVPAEALPACDRLATELRGENVRELEAWRDDVLQLHTQLYYAWMSLKNLLAKGQSHLKPQQLSTQVGRGHTGRRKEKQLRGSQVDRQVYRCPKCLAKGNKPRKTFYLHGIKQHLSMVHNITYEHEHMYAMLAMNNTSTEPSGRHYEKRTVYGNTS